MSVEIPSDTPHAEERPADSTEVSSSLVTQFPLPSHCPEYDHYRVIQPTDIEPIDVEAEENPGAINIAPEQAEVDPFVDEAAGTPAGAKPPARKTRAGKKLPTSTEPAAQPAIKKTQKAGAAKAKPAGPRQKESSAMVIVKEKSKPAPTVQTTLRKSRDGPQIVYPSAGTSASKDKQISLHVSPAAGRIQTRPELADAGFVSLDPTGEGDIESLAKLAADWNLADFGESNTSLSKLMPGASGVASQKLGAIEIAFRDAKETVEVRIYFIVLSLIHTCIPSPRVSG